MQSSHLIDPSYLWDKHFPIHIKIICWHPSLAGHVLLISVTQGKGKKEKVKIQTGFQEYWMPSIRFLNTSVALESIYHGEHFIVFGADIQGQNVIPWRELIRIKPNSLPCQNYVMNATLPAPVGLRPSCKSVSLESYWVHLRNTDPVPVVRSICLKNSHIKLLTKLPQVEILQRQYAACVTKASTMLVSHLQSFSCYFVWWEEPDQNPKDQPCMLRASPRVNASLFKWSQLC